MDLDITTLITRIRQVNLEVNALFLPLNREQLTYRPSNNSWSIAQCLDHLLKTNHSYFEEFESVMGDHYQNNWWKRINPFTKVIGQSMIKTLGADRTKSYASPKLFVPENTEHEVIVHRFLEEQVSLEKYINELKDKKEILIYSPVSAVITLRLEHAFQILVGHEERHILQAKEVLKSEEFPKNEE